MEIISTAGKEIPSTFKPNKPFSLEENPPVETAHIECTNASKKGTPAKHYAIVPTKIIPR